MNKTPVLNPDFLKLLFNAPPTKSNEATQNQAKAPIENMGEPFQPSLP
jgi:hypothetical protein